MVRNIQNYWVFGLCPVSDILKTREHNALVFMDLVCSLGLLHKAFTSLFILVLGLCML
jgi:hypothetical protein